MPEVITTSYGAADGLPGAAPALAGPYFGGQFGRLFSTLSAAEEFEFELYEQVSSLRNDVNYLLSNAVILGEQYADVSDICCPQIIELSDVCHHGVGHFF